MRKFKAKLQKTQEILAQFYEKIEKLLRKSEG